MQSVLGLMSPLHARSVQLSCLSLLYNYTFTWTSLSFCFLPHRGSLALPSHTCLCESVQKWSVFYIGMKHKVQGPPNLSSSSNRKEVCNSRLPAKKISHHETIEKNSHHKANGTKTSLSLHFSILLFCHPNIERTIEQLTCEGKPMGLPFSCMDICQKVSLAGGLGVRYPLSLVPVAQGAKSCLW